MRGNGGRGSGRDEQGRVRAEPTMDETAMELVQAAARNQAAWADKQLRAHGIECRWSEALWTSWQAGPATTIHHEAVTLTPGSAAEKPELMREIEQLVAAREQDQLEVTDWWRTLDLTSLGFELVWNTAIEPAPYLVRPPGVHPPVAVPPELEIARVRTPETLAEFESASFEGFETSGPHTPGRFHAPASLDDPDMRYFVGRVQGQAMSVSIGVVSEGVVGLFGVATKPAYRRRGYGTAMTWVALRSAPTSPAVLGPSDAGEPLYRKMGFSDFHQFRLWRRPGSH